MIALVRRARPLNFPEAAFFLSSAVLALVTRLLMSVEREDGDNIAISSTPTRSFTCAAEEVGRVAGTSDAAQSLNHHYSDLYLWNLADAYDAGFDRPVLGHSSAVQQKVINRKKRFPPAVLTINGGRANTRRDSKKSLSGAAQK
jgi:hypothetical protein